MIPIQSFDFGVDAYTGLQKKLYVTGIRIDAKTEVVYVDYDIVLLSPTGVQVSVIESYYFERLNLPGNEKYNELKNSPVGQGIIQMIGTDMAMIQSYETCRENLKQSR